MTWFFRYWSHARLRFPWVIEGDERRVLARNGRYTYGAFVYEFFSNVATAAELQTELVTRKINPGIIIMCNSRLCRANPFS